MSRTSLSIRNSIVSLSFYAIEMFLGFFSRKIFIDYIGIEVLGLNTTANNLLQFLNLAELGVGSAIAFVLYKPLAQNDSESVKEIVQVQGWIYKRIAIIVAIGAGILMLFFPYIFQKTELPLWYTYASFGVLLYGALLTYYTNYKQIVLSASQQEYKITLSYKSVIIVKNVVQIFAISHFANGYAWWLILQFIFSTLASVSLNIMIRKNFSYLENINTNVGEIVKEKYKIIITKVKQLFFHKIAGYVLTQTSPLIIYMFSSLTIVAIYGNYLLIINSISMLLKSVFNSVAAGVGNLIAEGDKERVVSVFGELFSSRFFCTIILTYCLYQMTNPFIKLWVGDEYLLSTETLVIMLLIMYVNLMRIAVENFIFGYGLFKDIWAPIVEAVLNLSLSIILGYFYGIVGVLLGVLISLILIVVIWKPFFLFKYGMKVHYLIYVKIYLRHLLLCLVAILISIYITSMIKILPDNFLNWFIMSIINFVTITFTLYVLLYAFTIEMRNFTKRCIKIVCHKK